MCQHDSMAEKMLTIRLSEDRHRALKLHAVMLGRSVQAVVTELIDAELAKRSPQVPGRSREEFVAELLARFDLDPDDPEVRASMERARANIRSRRSAHAGEGAA